VHHYFATQSFRRRVIALATALAIALSGLIAGFGTAHAAANLAAQPDAVICHGAGAEQSAPAPSPDDTNSTTCIGSCCIGCLMLTAALPAPPVRIIGALQSAGRLLQPPAIIALAARPDTTSHRSRAPPLPA